MNSHIVSWLLLLLWECIEFSFPFRELFLLFLNCWVESLLYSASFFFSSKNLKLHSTSVHLSEAEHNQSVWTFHMKSRGHWFIWRWRWRRASLQKRECCFVGLGGWNVNRICFLVSALTMVKTALRVEWLYNVSSKPRCFWEWKWTLLRAGKNSRKPSYLGKSECITALPKYSC